MPSGPTSRGCDACRKQKKKCDALTAACSRCVRLGIPCLGYGQQRYKFQDEGRKLARLVVRLATATTRDVVPADGSQPSLVVTNVSRPLSDDLSRFRLAFASSIDPSIDISMQLLGNFGGFLQWVPARLGTNESLDAAADSLVTAYTRYRAGGLTPDREMTVKHSRGLSALSRCLNDPIKAASSETLCAVWLLWMSQTFMGKKPKPRLSHSVGAAQILRGRGFSGPKNEFERILLLSLRGPVVVEALSDNKIQFTEEEWKNFVVSGLDDGTVEGSMMACLSRLPYLMHGGRNVLKRSTSRHSVAMIEVQLELRSLHDTYRPILEKLRQRWRNIGVDIMCKTSLNAMQKRFVHCHHSRMLAFGSAIGICMNCSLITFEPDNKSLRQETTQMSREIFDLSSAVAAYRPLGALSMHVCLGAAWIGTTDEELGASIEETLVDFQRDLCGSRAEFAREEWIWCRKQYYLT